MTQSRSGARDPSFRQSTITEFGRESWRGKLTAAIFLDRDGIVIEDRDYLADPCLIRFIPGALKALRQLQSQFRLIIVTNQSGVARGFFTEQELSFFHRQLLVLLNHQEVFVDAIYYCPHHLDLGRGEYRCQCLCRKPEPGLMLQAARDFKLDLKGSFLIGDKESDALAGKKARVYTFLLKQRTKRLASSSVADDRVESWTEILHKIFSRV